MPYVAAAAILFPLLSLAAIAAQGSGDLWPHLAAYVLPQATIDTVVLLTGVGLVVTLVGAGTAWIVSAYDFPGRRLFDWALLLPLAMPTYIVAFAYLDLTHPLGPIQGTLRTLLGITNPRDLWFPDVRSMAGCILLLGFVLYPYVYLTTRAMFLTQSACLIDASRTLGRSHLGSVLRVAMPLARPAIAVGISLALMEALNDVGAAEFLGVRTLTVSIYTTWINRSSLPGAAQIALVMLIIVIGLVALERYARRRQRYALSAQRARLLRPIELQGLPACAAFLACLVPVLIGFILPFAHLIQLSLERWRFAGLSRQILSEIVNTVSMSAIATLVCVSIGLGVAYAVRRARSRRAGVLLRLSSLGYAVPGTVMAIGLLTPLALFDNAVDGVMRSAFGISTGLLLSGTGFALVYAYTARFLTIANGGIEAGFARVAPSIDDAARLLGERPWRILTRIHLPLIRPAALSAALLVFVDCMKELPATLLLRPLNFETLATHVYAEAARGTYEDGAIAALLIVLIGLMPVVLLARASGRTQERPSSFGRPAPAEAAVIATP